MSRLILADRLCRFAAVLTVVAMVGLAGCGPSPRFGVEPIPDFASSRGRHRTKLVRNGPAPQSWEPFPEANGVRQIEYPSGAMRLKALLGLPENRGLAKGGKLPVLVYLHGGFAADLSDLSSTDAFRARGFVVLLPTYRGENGNPGSHEFAYGELDDARAAVAWIATQPELDPGRVAVFGHSAGGMLSSMLTLFDAPSVLDTGSTGGLYDASIFDQFDVPFKQDPKERALRLFAPHAAQMKRAHFACVGTDDAYPMGVIATLERQEPRPRFFRSKVVPGDHLTAVKPCIDAYLHRVVQILGES